VSTGGYPTVLGRARVRRRASGARYHAHSEREA
jgi:hypothetical protein